MLSFTSQEQAHTPLPGWGFLRPWVLRTPLPSSRLRLQVAGSPTFRGLGPRT